MIPYIRAVLTGSGPPPTVETNADAITSQAVHHKIVTVLLLLPYNTPFPDSNFYVQFFSQKRTARKNGAQTIACINWLRNNYILLATRKKNKPWGFMAFVLSENALFLRLLLLSSKWWKIEKACTVFSWIATKHYSLVLKDL